MANQDGNVTQSTAATNSVFATPTECLWNEHMNSVKSFHIAFQQIEVLLDPKRPLGGDYRSLASQFGMDLNEINFLGSQPNPTATLLNKHNPTLDQLRRYLISTEMHRSDVVNVMTVWIKEHYPGKLLTTNYYTIYGTKEWTECVRQLALKNRYHRYVTDT